MEHPLQHQNIKHNPQLGFTLVELAIALMVIGLLIGGVLKGQELIENARITATIRQIKAYDAATLIFRNTYNAIPGDIKRPNRIPNCTEEPCSLPGNGNGRIYTSDTSPESLEPHNFFPHLTKAGLIQGPEGGTAAQFAAFNDPEPFFPSTPFDLHLAVNAQEQFHHGSYSDTGDRPNAYEIPSIHSNMISNPILPVQIMARFDMKLDDGKPHSGDVQVLVYGDCPSMEYAEGGGNEYATDDSTNDSCPLGFRAGF